MSEEEKNPTTGLADDAGKNGMGGVTETPPKKKTGRPRKVPGDPNNKPATIGEYIAMHPRVAEQVSTNVYGKTTTYDPSLTADEIVARDLDRHMEIMALPRVDLTDAKNIEGRYIEYMQICRKYGKRMTVAGFAEALGMTREALWKWATGVTPKPKPVVDILNAALTAINAELEDLMVSNKINPVSGIFLLKQSGYRDNVDLTIKTDPTTEKSEEQLAAEYLDSIPVVDD